MSFYSYEELDDPVKVEYIGRKGTTPYVGEKSFKKYYFGSDNKIAYIERVDLEGFLNKKIRGSSIFRTINEVPQNRMIENEDEVVFETPLADDALAEFDLSGEPTEEDVKVEDVVEVVEEEVETKNKKKSKK